MSDKVLKAPKSLMDARKFLATINDGSVAQAKMLEQKLSKLGSDIGSDYKLISVNGPSIYFEDAKTNKYFKADWKRDERQFVVENIQQIEIIDQKKSEIFGKACSELVNAIEEGDQSKAVKIFGQIERGHCTSKIIPESGMIRTRDGVVRKISMKADIYESVKPKMVTVLKEAVKASKMTIKEGTIVVEHNKIKLPINEFTRRQVVARRMITVAENAYRSSNFNKLVKAVAGYVSNGQLNEAISVAKDFLASEQEFCMLGSKKFGQLVENSLFISGVFNNKIIEDTSKLMWEANLRINKDDIIREWSVCADKINMKAFYGNVKILKESGDKFAGVYDQFIDSVIAEDVSSKAIKAQAYLNMLKLLNNIVSGSDADAIVKSQVDELIMKLEGDINNIDDATLYQVEDLLATVSADLLTDVATLGDFDKVPEPKAADQFGGDEAEMVGEFDGDMDDNLGGLGGSIGGADLGAGPDLGGEAAPAGPEAAGEVPAADAGAAAVPEVGAEAPKAEEIPAPEGEEETEEEELTLDHKETYKNVVVEDVPVDQEYNGGVNKTVKESMVAVADSDDKLIELVSKALEVADSGEQIISEPNKDSGVVNTPVPAAVEKEEKTEDKKEEVKEEGKENKEIVKEDNNITSPDSKEFTSEKTARQDGEGDERNEKIKFDTKDYDGSGEFKVAKK